jgi:di/tricarboxylate transporter
VCDVAVAVVFALRVPEAAAGRGRAVSDSAITFVVLGVVVVLFVWNRFPPEIVALGAAIALYTAGVLDSNQVFAGFGDPVVPFLAGLFVISEGLDASGVTGWAGQQLISHAGSRSRLVVALLVFVAILGALITPNGAVAALLPMAVLVALRIGRAPSQLLMPLAFGASAGSLLVLTGSPVNLLVSEASAAAVPGGGFGFFAFAVAGVPLVIGAVAAGALLGSRLLPAREPGTMTADLSRHARTLAQQYDLDQRILRGDEVSAGLLSRESGVAEVVIPPRSELVGETAFAGMVTSSGDLIVLAIQRAGQNLEDGRTELREGDTLLLRGSWGALDENLEGPEVLVVDPPDAVRRQAVPLGPGSKRAIAVLVGTVVLLATGVVPAAVASVLGACAMVVLGVVTVEKAYRSISWTTVVLIGAMIAVSTAVTDTGAARQLADALVDIVGGAGSYALLSGLFVLTATLGQLISNTATALIVIPIAVSAANQLDVSPRPVLMSVAVAAAASFLTPVATPANLMIMGPGGYRFGDYWKLGLVLMALFFAVSVFLVPVVWTF